MSDLFWLTDEQMAHQRRSIPQVEIRHPTTITAGEDDAREDHYKIIGADRVVLTALTDANTTDAYLHVPDTTTVETDWSEGILAPYMPRNMPKTLDFRWVDFKTFLLRTDNNLRTLHPLARHRYFAFINKAKARRQQKLSAICERRTQCIAGSSTNYL